MPVSTHFTVMVMEPDSTFREENAFPVKPDCRFFVNQIFVERENQVKIVLTQRILLVVAEGSGEKAFSF